MSKKVKRHRHRYKCLLCGKRATKFCYDRSSELKCFDCGKRKP